MDRAGEGLVPSAARFAQVLRGQRRQSAKGVSRLLQQLIGLRPSSTSTRAVRPSSWPSNGRAGRTCSARAWESAAHLPSLIEIREPHRWIDRTRVPLGAVGEPACPHLGTDHETDHGTDHDHRRGTERPPSRSCCHGAGSRSRARQWCAAFSGGADSLALLVLAVAADVGSPPRMSIMVCERDRRGEMRLVARGCRAIRRRLPVRAGGARTWA